MMVSPTILMVIAVGLVGYWISIAIYRLYIHPLSHFPGPKLAALSLWYEFYYDVIKRGQFIWQIQAMHERYGPIIRINPHELHINDPEYYDELYGSATRKRDKYSDWVALSGTPGSSFATVNHNHHRTRRAALNPFFSKRAVTSLEPIILAKVNRLCQRFADVIQNGEVIRVDAAFVALTMDVISQYSFAVDDDYLSEPDFKVAWKETLEGAFEGGALLRQFPWMFGFMNWLPDRWMKKMSPSMGLMLDWKRGVRARVSVILERNEGVEDGDGDGNGRHRSIFHELRDSGLPEKEKTIDRLCDEGTILTGAGTETTAMALTKITFYLLKDRNLVERLRDELRTIMPTSRSEVTVTQLEQLPYLSAVISEGLRISIGVSNRLPRIATEEVLKYKDWVIPSGTPVSESTYFVLTNPQIFPDPSLFNPSRWIKDSKYNTELDKYLVCFGRGTRQCVGINLAYAELYLSIAKIFRRFDLGLFETTVEDIAMAHDFFTPVARLDSKGVRIHVVGEAK